MNEIICPNCGKAFKIDEAGYADILKQVRDADFEKQLHKRLELAEQDKRNAIELAEAKLSGELQKAATAKDTEIQALKAKLDAGDVARKLAVTEALSPVEKERDALANELAQARLEKEAATRLAEAKLLAELQKSAATKDARLPWFLVLGSWFLVLGSWFLVLGSWFLVLGSWFLVLGSWFLVRFEPVRLMRFGGQVR